MGLARVALAPNLHWLHGIDPLWTSDHVLRRMAWGWPSRADTLGIWRGYLFAPRYTLHRLGPLRPLLLEALRHFDEPGEQAAAEACRFFVAVCIEQPNAFSGSEIDRAIGHMGPSGLAKGAQVLEWKLRDAGRDAAELWRRRIGPCIERHWPDAADFLAEPVVAEANDLLLQMCEAFPEALAMLERKRLVPELSDDQGRARPQLIVHPLLSPGRTDGSDGFDYVGRFPGDVTRWIVHIVRREPSTYLRQRLAELAERLRIVRPELVDTPDYKWLAGLGG